MLHAIWSSLKKKKICIGKPFGFLGSWVDGDIDDSLTQVYTMLPSSALFYGDSETQSTEEEAKT